MACMHEDSLVRRRFGPDFVAEHQRNYGKRQPEQRQLTYDIAVNEDCAPWRQWLDDQLAVLPARAADAMARRIWLDEHFWPVNFEIATGAGLRAVGLAVAYEQNWDGLTPDWTILSESGNPLAFVEVHTDQPPSGVFGHMRAWHGLVERIKATPVAVVLQVASAGGPVVPPDAGTAKKIAADLRNKLVQNPAANMFLSHGYRFLVMGDRRRGGQQMISPLGMHACFVPPSSRAGPVSAVQLMERVEEKVKTYAELANAYEVPLIVAVGAHRFTGVTLGHVDDILTGLPAPKVTFQFDAGDPYIGEQAVNPGQHPVNPGHGGGQHHVNPGDRQDDLQERLMPGEMTVPLSVTHPQAQQHSDEHERRKAELRARAEQSAADMDAATALAYQAALATAMSGKRPGLSDEVDEWRQARPSRVVVGTDFGQPETVPVAAEVPTSQAPQMPTRFGNGHVAGYTQL